jgi:hypothetical protein
MKAIRREFKLAPSSLTYAMILFVKLNSTNKTFTYFVRVAPKISGASNNLTIM